MLEERSNILQSALAGNRRCLRAMEREHHAAELEPHTRTAAFGHFSRKCVDQVLNPRPPQVRRSRSCEDGPERRPLSRVERHMISNIDIICKDLADHSPQPPVLGDRHEPTVAHHHVVDDRNADGRAGPDELLGHGQVLP